MWMIRGIIVLLVVGLITDAHEVRGKLELHATPFLNIPKSHDNNTAHLISNRDNRNKESNPFPAFNDPPTVSVHPAVSTPSTPKDADDPAIWIHPTDPAKSLVFGTDKFNGIYVYDLQGRVLQQVPIGGRGKALNNIDVRKGFKFGTRTIDILAGNIRDVGKLAFYEINPDYSATKGDILLTIADRNSSNNDLQRKSYGFGLYRRPSDGSLYVFDKPTKRGAIQQYKIEDDGSGSRIKVTHVRTLNYSGGTAEGFVADDVRGHIYISEEHLGIHKYWADPGKPTNVIHTFAKSGGVDQVIPDREGLSLYQCPSGEGYLVLSNQMADNVKIYELGGDNKFVKTVIARDESGHSNLGSDGLDSTAHPLPGFPHGILVAHDGPDRRFHWYDWEEIAGNDLTNCHD